MMMGRSSLEGRVQSALRGNRRKLCAMIGRPRYVRAIAGGFHPRRPAACVRGHALAQKLSKNGLLYAMKVRHCCLLKWRLDKASGAEGGGAWRSRAAGG